MEANELKPCIADNVLCFTRGYKYQTKRDFHVWVDIKPFAPIKLQFIEMDMDGNLLISRGYAWNGASGPTWDTLNSMIGSLVHDVLYQLIRLGLIDADYKEYADRCLHDLCTRDGMYTWRADYWRWAVLKFGAGSCRPSGEPAIEAAP